MAVWSIDIVPGEAPGDPSGFVCELQPNAPPNTILAQTGDAVTWNNQTDQSHQIEIPPDKNGTTFVSEVIPADHASRPTYLCVGPKTGNEILYSCKLHPEDQGVIVLTDVAPATS
jgi:plastocyanin